MLYILIIIATVFIANNAVNSAECQTVKEGKHSASLIPFFGFKSDASISIRVQFTNSCASYVFPSTEPDRALCARSWNKLWGAYSDRFVFRRDQRCPVYELEHVNGKYNDCPEANLIEIAAYAYDNGTIPYEHPDKLMREFSTRLLVGIWYKLTLISEETKTIYQLFDNNNQLLETQEIDHRQCKDFSHGTIEELYFGGQCPAPQDVSVCYKKN